MEPCHATHTDRYVLDPNPELRNEHPCQHLEICRGEHQVAGLRINPNVPKTSETRTRSFSRHCRAVRHTRATLSGNQVHQFLELSVKRESQAGDWWRLTSLTTVAIYPDYDLMIMAWKLSIQGLHE
jgi:hypothetical protein